MRKWQQEKLHHIIDSLGELHLCIQDSIDAQEYGRSLELLADCQKSAIDVGHVIEETEGEDCVTVSLLEEYCEALYLVSQKLDGSIDGKSALLMLKDNIENISKSVTTDIVIRKEVVFFPYKASMWDSLESIYLAAIKDQNCDAYCVPIPYFDKNPDGSFGEIHYEGNEYPANILITDWKAYSFEERMPDAIYIHNPYDEYNYVTSVHPRFYASNLYKYTNMLVYVPYFVLPEIEPNNQAQIDKIKHFCYTAGTIYANKVILQSENIRQIYINEYLKEMEERGKKIDRKVLEKRFVETGSPKFDKVRRMRKEDFEIPEEWLTIMRKKDGSWKKVVFYNIGISELLQYKERMLSKIKYALEIFSKYKEDIVLLWRPHPLIGATIQSMCPELTNGYQGIIAKYKEEGWGIYDESTNMDRAVALSNAFYGDSGSVMQLFRHVGKPVMIQSAVEFQQKKVPPFEAAVDTGDYYWYVPTFENALYRINKTTNTIEFVTNFFHEKIKALLFSKIVSYKNMLIFIPNLADYITIFTPDNNNMYKLDYIKGRSILSQGNRFGSAILDGDNLYLIPITIKEIVELNLENYEMKSYDISFGEIEESVLSVKFWIFSWRFPIQVGRRIFIPLMHNKGILIFDLDSKNFEQIFPGNLKLAFESIFYVNNRFWLIPSDGKRVYIWNPVKNLIEKEMDMPSGFLGSTPDSIRNFGVSGIKDGIIYLFAMKANMSIAIVTDGEVVYKIDVEENMRVEDDFLDSRYKYSHFFDFNNRLIVQLGKSGKFLEIVKKETNIYLEQLNDNTNFSAQSLHKKLELLEGIILESEIPQSYFLNYIKET